MGDKLKILSIDGGGVRGIYPATLLKLIEEKLNIKIYDNFDLIVGTSTGSIVAGAIAVNYDLSSLIKDFETDAPNIFQKRWDGLFKSKYDIKKLEYFLMQKFGGKKLGEIEKPLILNATNITSGQVHVFKSRYQLERRQGDYTRDAEVLLYKAVLASCAAPTYFDPVKIGDDLLCDGGLWANNPSLVGYTDAVQNFKFNHQDIKILSIGTGQANRFYDKSKCWGWFTGWKKTKLVDFAMSIQTQFPENTAKLLLKDNFLRINSEIEDWGLDNYENIPKLKNMAVCSFNRHFTTIKSFIG